MPNIDTHLCIPVATTVALQYIYPLASFPGLPHFSSSVCVHYTETQTEELKWQRPGNEASYPYKSTDHIISLGRCLSMGQA